MSGIVLIGAGGHVESLRSIIEITNSTIEAYVDPRENKKLASEGIVRLSEEQLSERLVLKPHLAMGFVGLDTIVLERRLALFHDYQSKGASFPHLIHPQAMIDSHAMIGEGAHILAGAIINRGAIIGRASVVNSGAIIEHGAVIGDGCHIAPGAIVLGDVTLGECCFVGSGAVVVQQAQVAPKTRLRALSIHKS